MTEPTEPLSTAPPVEVQRAVIVTKLGLALSLVLSFVAVLNRKPLALLGFFFGLFCIWLVLFLLRRIESGVNWARITLVVWSVLGLAIVPLYAPTEWAERPVSFVLIQVPMVIVCALTVWWLVSEPARTWFREVREESRGARFEENA